MSDRAAESEPVPPAVTARASSRTTPSANHPAVIALSRSTALASPESNVPGGAHGPLLSNVRFLKLWLAQVLSATGDWLGLVAITALAARVGGQAQGVAIGLVLSARIAPGLFLGPLAGLCADRWNRRRLLVTCDVGRALVLFSLPFVDTIVGLVLASLLLEMFTLLWSPAKEASVPDIVPEDQLTAANSLSVAAAYGTFPVGAGLYALLSNLAGWLDQYVWLERLRLDQAGLAFVVDGFTFLAAAALIGTIKLPTRPARAAAARAVGVAGVLREALRDLVEGWRFVFINPVVRAVNLGLATGLIGGGMLVPLGPDFVDQVLGRGDEGFGYLIFALGIGMALGVAGVAALQHHVPKQGMFEAGVFGAGIALLAAASMSDLQPAALLIAFLGLCAGTVYVMGFTLLHEKSTPELRGRIFGALFIMVRFCVLLAFAVAPLLSKALNNLSGRLFEDHRTSILGGELYLPGVRITLWLAGFIIVGAGFVSRTSLRSGHAAKGVDEETDHDVDEAMADDPGASVGQAVIDLTESSNGLDLAPADSVTVATTVDGAVIDLDAATGTAPSSTELPSDVPSGGSQRTRSRGDERSARR